MSRPWSLFGVFSGSLKELCMAFLISKVVVWFAQSSILVFSQRSWWCLDQACSATNEFSVSPLLMAASCSFKRVYNALFVPPTYLQLQGTEILIDHSQWFTRLLIIMKLALLIFSLTQLTVYSSYDMQETECRSCRAVQSQKNVYSSRKHYNQFTWQAYC